MVVISGESFQRRLARDFEYMDQMKIDGRSHIPNRYGISLVGICWDHNPEDGKIWICSWSSTLMLGNPWIPLRSKKPQPCLFFRGFRGVPLSERTFHGGQSSMNGQLFTRCSPNGWWFNRYQETRKPSTHPHPPMEKTLSTQTPPLFMALLSSSRAANSSCDKGNRLGLKLCTCEFH